jgi:hypothetical protein
MNATTEYPQNDSEFQDHVIELAEKESDGGWSIKNEDGWSFFVPASSPVEPVAGMRARFYGPGIGYTVRGLFLDGRKVFYRTEAEENERHRKWCEEREREQKYDFEKNRVDIDRRVAALPEVFQRRLQKFRTNNPDFRWKFEGYELFCCEQAVLIAAAVGSADAVSAFHKLPWTEQLAKVPGLSDGHSGNTFGIACSLAMWYLTQPENVVRLHGALAPLVGSQEYGCVPKQPQP